MQNIEQLGGVMPALVSPLNADGSVDVPGTRRLIEHVVAGGVSGVVALGSTGESATLGRRERRALVTAVADALSERVPMIVGVAQVDLDSAIEEIRAAAASGGSAVLVTPPYYAPPDQPSMLEFYRRLAAEASVPILIYNIPMYTKVSVEPETVRILAEEGTVVGMKDSSSNFAYHTRVLATMRDVPAFRLFMGNETMLLPALVMGGCGTICATANVAPRLLCNLMDHVRNGQLEVARAEEFEVVNLVAGLMTGGLPAGFKAALALMGICQPHVAPPNHGLSPQQHDMLRDFVTTHPLLRAAAAVPN
jgi:4-hydroxy-tetrahydrodipicolinate synthase